MGKKQKSAKPPLLPPDIPDDEIEVSDEDLDFVVKNRQYANFVSRLDTRSIDRHVTRVADEQDDQLEVSYEKRFKQRSLELEKENENGLEVDPVDALPIKTETGEIVYRRATKVSSKPQNQTTEAAGVDDEDSDGGENSVVKLTKPEKRAKMKKSRKEAKQQAKELPESQEPESTPQAEVVAKIEEELTAEKTAEVKKQQIAELGTTLLSDPEGNIRSLKTMLQFCNDKDKIIAKLGLLSCLAIFRDIIPGYRIRLLTEKELEMNVSKAVKKTRYFEFTLLSAYKTYLQRLLNLERDPLFHQVAVRCLCTLLETVPHFNFRENLLPAVVKNIGSLNDATRTICCSTIKSLFLNEGKHGGEATLEAVRLISDEVKLRVCHMHPDAIEVFLSLSFDEDLGKSNEKDDKPKYQKNKRRRKGDDQKQALIDDKKRSRKEMLKKTRDEVNTDFKAASFTQDVEERKKTQSKTLAALFNTYFRVLKHAIEPVTTSFQGLNKVVGGALGPHPLLDSCLKGVGKFSHFIDLDFMADLMKVLKILASGNTGADGSEGHLTVSERLQCCIIAFKVMKNNLDALKIDLQDFFVQLYNLIIEHRPASGDDGHVLAEALKVMLCDDRHHDMQRAAAFIKRLATSSLFFGSAESMAALVTVKQLLQKNVKCRNMLENDPGGGSVSGSIVKYQPYSSDPHLSGALASVLWELNLLSNHFHPAVSTMASSILSMSAAPNQAFMSTLSPLQAFTNFSLDKESFKLDVDVKKIGGKRKRGASSLSDGDGSVTDATALPDEECLKKKLSDHFIFLRDIEENERLRHELNRTTSSLNLYEKYKKQKQMVQRSKQRK